MTEGLLPGTWTPSYYGSVPDLRAPLPASGGYTSYPHRHITDKELRP
ncbi:hypothetical protein JL475_34215 [Streptomyces sp. M2CJ-2]|nr:hypothetical protein [Streptomyces sp. M2CJ-2]MBL3670916.1 hypothetical protein [Streptomyces sp. M2CJ-2]